MNKKLLAGLAISLAATSIANAVLVIDRGLPTANLNNVSGANRSNVSWGFGQNPEEYFSGDDFTLGATGDSNNPVWKINTITTWATAGPNNDSNFDLSDRFLDARLYVGGLSGLSLVQSTGFANSAKTGDNPDVIISKVNYSNGEGYQGTSGSFIQLWKIEWTNLNLIVNPGELTQFGVTGSALDQSTHTWFNHASNAALSGSTQQGSDDLYRYHTLNDLASGSGAWTSNGNGWDKASDVNILVEAEAVPEPATMLLASALIPFLARKRKKSN